MTTSVQIVHFLTWFSVLLSFDNQRFFAKGQFSLANFVQHSFHYLNATKVGSHFVHEVEACHFACVGEFSCASFNVAALPDIKGHFVCELLASDKYKSTNHFMPHQDYHHHSIHVRLTPVFFLIIRYHFLIWAGRKKRHFVVLGL